MVILKMKYLKAVPWTLLFGFAIILAFNFVIPAKAGDYGTTYGSSGSMHIAEVTEFQVTEHSKYIVDHRFGGLCYYETSSSVGIYVSRVEDKVCARMLKGAE